MWGRRAVQTWEKISLDILIIYLIQNQSIVTASNKYNINKSQIREKPSGC
jgi:hypothetical protein